MRWNCWWHWAFSKQSCSFYKECSESSPLNTVVTSQDLVLRFTNLCLFQKASNTSPFVLSAFRRAVLSVLFSLLYLLLNPLSQHLQSLTCRTACVLSALWTSSPSHSYFSHQDSWVLIVITTKYFLSLFPCRAYLVLQVFQVLLEARGHKVMLELLWVNLMNIAIFAVVD